MNLISTSFYTGIATLIRTISGFLLNKILAIYVGPSGLAFIGQFQSFVGMILQFASGAINTGVVKYTSEFRNNEEEKRKIFSTALCIGLAASIPVAIILLVFAVELSDFFLKTDVYANVFRVFAITLFLYVLNNLLMSILNGQQDIKRYNVANVLSSIIGLILTGFCVYSFGLEGALYAMVINQSVVLVSTLTLLVKSNWFNLKSFTGGLNRGYVKKFTTYTAMALVSAVVVPTSQIVLRDFAGQSLSWQEVGYWEGLVRISNAYLLLITTTLSVYYLPKLSELSDNFQIKREIFYGYKVILPVVLVMASFVYIARDLIIVLLFSNDFLPMRDLFAVQLIGDIIKISSWLLANIMLAKAMGKLFIFSEVFFCGSLVALGIYLTHIFGIVGLVYAYCINYSLYLIFNIFCFRKILFASS